MSPFKFGIIYAKNIKYQLENVVFGRYCAKTLDSFGKISEIYSD